MIVISDTNIIYSCFYKPEGVIATILKNRKNKLQFIAPSYLLDEIEEHLPQIMKKNLIRFHLNSIKHTMEKLSI